MGTFLHVGLINDPASYGGGAYRTSVASDLMPVHVADLCFLVREIFYFSVLIKVG